jgi:2-haloacid dehalogenase
MKQNSSQHPAIIFDFGGVLMDWNAHYLYDKLLDDPADLERFFNEISFHNWNLEMDRGRSFAESVTELSSQFPQYADLIRAFDERWEETLGGPIQSTVEILQALKVRGYDLYGLTNWSAEKYEITRHKYPFFDLFDDIVVSGIVKLVKPDPRIFTLMLEKADRPAAECLLIDDSEANTIAARRLGFKTIHFKSAEQLGMELSCLGILDEEYAKCEKAESNSNIFARKVFR